MVDNDMKDFRIIDIVESFVMNFVQNNLFFISINMNFINVMKI